MKPEASPSPAFLALGSAPAREWHPFPHYVGLPGCVAGTPGLDAADPVRRRAAPSDPGQELIGDPHGGLEIPERGEDGGLQIHQLGAPGSALVWRDAGPVHLLAELGVEFIEQPLPPGDPAQHELFNNCKLPVIADESCVREADVDSCGGNFDGVNIKLCKCGGPSTARRMALRARELGLRVMVGCMTESTVGISAAAQVGPLTDFLDLDGAVLLAEDAASGVRVEQGRLHYPDRPGAGVELL